MAEKKLLLGIDAGSSSTKLALYETDGTLYKEGAFPVKIHRPNEVQAEIDLDALWADLVVSVKSMAGRDAAYIQGIGFSVANPTLVFLDAENEPVRRGIAYFDNRSQKDVEGFVERFGGANRYFAEVGNHPSPSTMAAAAVYHVKMREPEVWASVKHVGFLNTFFGVKFTGELACDPTTASYSGLLSIRKPLDWEDEFVKIFELNSGELPRIVPCLDSVGGVNEELAKETGIPAGTPVSIGSADTAAASFAMGAWRHGDVFQSMGTSEVAVFCLGTSNFSDAFMNRAHVVPGLWLANGAMSNGGGSIRWFLREIAPECADERELEALAMSSPRGANGVIFLPYLDGERSPMFDAKAQGMFFGISARTTKADLARAVYEGIAYAMSQIYTIGKERWEIEPPFIVAIGGTTKSPLSLRLRAAMQNIPFRTVDISNAAGYGAAMMGGFAAGVYKEVWDFPVIDNFQEEVLPNPEDVLFYEKRKAIYNALYPRLVEEMHALYDADTPM